MKKNTIFTLLAVAFATLLTGCNSCTSSTTHKASISPTLITINGTQLIKRGRGNRFERFEVLHQCLFARLAYAGDTVQTGGKAAAAVLFVVVGDGKAVDLFLDTAHKGEEGRRMADAQLLSLGRYQSAGAVLVVLDHAQNRQGETQRVQGLPGDAGVGFAAVDEQ